MSPPQTAKQTKGAIHQVPCPHCGRKADLRGLQAQGGDVFGVGESISCDYCHLVSKIVLVQTVTVVALVQAPGRRPPDGSGPAPAQRAVKLPVQVTRALNARRSR